MRRIITAVVLLGCLGTVHVMAHGNATGIVRERMDMMVVMDKAMKEMVALLWSTDDDGQVLAGLPTLAETVRSHAGEAMTVKFPEGTDAMPSEATPQIWQDWESFVELAERTAWLAELLSETADNPRLPNAERVDLLASVQGIGPAVDLPVVESLEEGRALNMAPEMAFALLSETCSACHDGFRR